MSTITVSNLPRIAVVLVVHDGAEWLGNVLATIAAQTYPALDLVVVDNASTDASAQMLARRLPAERLIALGRNAGFGRAVAAALQHELVASAEFLLLLHDDLALAPDAVMRLALALREDPALGIVGPKLREWSDDALLQEVGMTIDRFGRAETALEPGELDQGQHDQQREALYVSTAGMMLRTEVVRTLGGFDARYPGLRDDLDLCWRAWIAGQRVAVVPGAVGYHIAAASRFVRGFGSDRSWRARELAERHTLATLIKNYGRARLLWVLPVVALLAVGKTTGFLATRRFGDALAVVRAYLWNVVHLPRTLRRRSIVQSRRVVADAELAHLFAPGLPRARAYGEAIGNWLAGGSTRALIEDVDGGVEVAAPTGHALVRSVKTHPAAWSAAILLLAYLAGLVPLLGPGQLIGGQIAPWPASVGDFFQAYASPWSSEPLASGLLSSPVQVLLGGLSLLGFGSAWLAQRVVVFGLLPLGWVLALRAGRLITPSAAPRVLGATLYVLSPALLGALNEGRFGVLLVGALLPAIALLSVRILDVRTAPSSAWRAGALLALLLSAALAGAPSLAPLFVVGYVVALGIGVGLRDRVRQPAAAMLAAGGITAGLLVPWVIGVVRNGAGLPAAPDSGPLPLWRAITAAPALVAGLDGLGAVLVVATALAVLLAAVLLGLPAQPWPVVGLVGVAAVTALAAWAASRLGPEWLWVPGLLLPVALAIAALGVIAARHLEAGLRQHAFGPRQVAVVVSAVVLGVGLVAGIARVATAPWDGLARDAAVAPAFVLSDTPHVGPYRVVVLDSSGQAIAWEVLAGSGPRMTGFGAVESAALSDSISDAVAAAVGGADLRAGTRLGVLNVRYVVIAADDPELRAVLSRQPALEPLPSGQGRVFRVQTWLPRAVVLAPERSEHLVRTGDPGTTRTLETEGLRRLRPGLYSGAIPHARGGMLVISEAASPVWEAAGTEGRLERRSLRPVNAFVIPEEAPLVTARATGGGAHTAVLLLQALVLLGAVSLALRPPGFTQARARRAAPDALPSALARETVVAVPAHGSPAPAGPGSAEAGVAPSGAAQDVAEPGPVVPGTIVDEDSEDRP